MAVARHRVPLSQTDAARRQRLGRWRDQLAASLFIDPLAALTDAAVAQAAAHAGLTLAVPESAVIDTGSRRVVYLESMPGMYDAVEVAVGRRCGDLYPVRGGLDFGQRVVTAGAVLLDAETRLNPALAASYFGAGARTIRRRPPHAARPRVADDAGRLKKFAP
ncbi:MAG: hypothetical protein U0871_08380 [Gemmataceae bacterium]